jgi:hypothetical protein
MPPASLSAMADQDKGTQSTQPRGKDDQGQPAKPVKIPVPSRKEVFDLMRAVTGKRSDSGENGE